jgi:hypothetical protein
VVAYDPQFLDTILSVSAADLLMWIILWWRTNYCKHLIRIGCYDCGLDLCQVVSCSVLTVGYSCSSRFAFVVYCVTR